MSVLLALFSALGAVLLFLLKLVGILLLIGMVFLALVLFCPFCADVQWEQGVFTVKAGALGLAFPVFQYPKPRAHGTRRTQGPAWQTESKIPRLACGTQSEKGGGKSSKTRKAQKRNASPQKGKTYPQHHLYDAAGSRAADPGDLRGAAVYQNPHLPWCPGRRPRAGGPHLWQAERLALHLAGCSGPLSSSWILKSCASCRISAVRSPPWKTGSRSGYRRGCFSSFVPPCAFFTSSGAKKCWTYSSDLCYNSTVW